MVNVPPRAVGERLDHNEGEHREDDDHDREHAHERERARHRPELHLHHLAERAAVAPHRDEEHQHVLHRAGEHHADEDPERPRQVAHLRGEHRPDQRPGAGDGGEVVAVEHILVGGHVVHAVVVPHRRRRALRIHLQHPLDEELAVEAVCEEVHRERGGHQPHRAHRLAALQGDRGERKGAEDADGGPKKVGRELVHGHLLGDGHSLGRADAARKR